MRQAAAAPWAAPLGNGWPGHSGGGGRGAWSREVRAAIYHSAAPMGPKKPHQAGETPAGRSGPDVTGTPYGILIYR